MFESKLNNNIKKEIVSCMNENKIITILGVYLLLISEIRYKVIVN